MLGSPLISALAACALGACVAPWACRVIGSRAAWLLALIPAAIFLLLGSRANEILAGQPVSETWKWADGLGLELAFRLDGLGLLFASLISGIGALVVIYAGAYLKDHPHLGRLYAALFVFMGAMLGIATSDNLLAVFVFWELTSVSSYMLIGFDHQRERARFAATQALLVTATGGLALLAGVILLAMAGGSWNISELDRAAVVSHAFYPWIAALVILGCATKSAQFPFHFWLPNAMEAPAPVSAYLHSSTMVKAGVFLLARLTPILGSAGTGTGLWAITLTTMGAITAVYAGLQAFRERALKRMLAYTTVSALGMIVLGLGIGSDRAIEGAIAFLIAHALYKGALFMVAGAIEHETGEKDTEKLSGLMGPLWMIGLPAMVAALSMMGVVPAVGFVAKEVLLEGTTHASGAIFAPLLTGALVLAAILNIAVAIATGVRPFLGAKRPTPHDPHGAPLGLWLGPAALALVTLALGVVPGKWLSSVVAAAATNVAGYDASNALHTHLHLFHGVTLELALSIGAFVLGLGLFAARGPFRRACLALAGLDRVGPEAGYATTLTGSLGAASAITAVIQSGRVRVAMLIIVATGVVGATAAMLHFGVEFTGTLTRISAADLLLITLIFLAGLSTALAQRRLAVIASFGIMGLGVALLYVMYGAPDLALTQVCVDALSTVLLLLVFRRIPEIRRLSASTARWRDAAIAASCGVLVAAMVFMASTSTHDNALRNAMSSRAYLEAHGRNVVNVILVDFRGLDTMGEITVLAVAALGVHTLMRSALKDPAAHARSNASRAHGRTP